MAELLAFETLTYRERRAFDRGKLAGLKHALDYPKQTQMYHDKLHEALILIEKPLPLPPQSEWVGSKPG